MTLKFDVSSLENWAAFSGDYNPIHFDVNAAKQIGLENVAVHGMLAMLPLKQHRYTIASHTANGYQWRFILRHPLMIDHNYQLSVKHASEKISLSLCAEDSAQKRLIATIQPINFSEQGQRFEQQDLKRFTIESMTLETKQHEFNRRFHLIDVWWIYLDSLIFSLFMAYHTKPLFTDKLKFFVGEQGHFIGDNVLFLHTRHQISIAQSLHQKGFDHTLSNVAYGVIIDNIVHHHNTLLVSFVLPLWIDEQLAMIVEMDIMGIKKKNLI